MNNDLKQQLGIGEDKPIPADYNVPFFIHEEDMNRMDKIHKRESTWKNIIIIILIFLFVGTNAYWIWYTSQFEDVTITQEVDAEADDNSDINLNMVGGDYYGRESESKTNS